VTEEELNAIKARLAAALPAPWTGTTIRRSLDGDCLAIIHEKTVTVGATLLPRYGDNETAVMLLHARADMDALVAEVERLREVLAVNVMSAYPDGVAEGERRIVAYLRRETHPCCAQCNNELATYIERGDHLLEDA
jgi:hypothetical protein